MMTAQHTPGPWMTTESAEHWGRVNVTVCAAFTANEIATAWQGTTDVNRANARLIAAAPDLLAELKNLRRAYVSILETGRDRIIQHGGQCDSVEVMEKADPYLKSSSAAIAKATGEIHG